MALPVALWGTTVHVVPTMDGIWRGVSSPPGFARILLAAAAGAVVAWALRNGRATASTPLLAGLLAGGPLIPLATGTGAVLLVFQRPGMILVLSAAVALALAGSGALATIRRGSPFWLAFAFFGLVARHTPGPAGPQGDEPHYLLMAESLRSDADLDLADELQSRDYSSFYSGELAPHTSPASPAGTAYPIHSPGVALLVLPAFAAGGVTGARLLMAVLAAAAAALVHRLARETTGREGAAWAGWAAFAFTPPLGFYAVALYPETPACLAAAVFLLASRREPSRAWLTAAALAAAALPWLHPKFLPLAAVGLALVAVRPGPRTPRITAVLVPAASAAALLLFFQARYGSASLAAAYGPGFAGDVTLSRIPRGLQGLFFDRQFGLFTWSPVWLLALPGLALLLRARTGDGLRALLVGGSAAVVGASFSMWWGGTCPPARFLVPAVPTLALAVGHAAAARPKVTAAAIGLGAGMVLLAADAPRVLHNRADGESALLRHLAPGLDLDVGLPSFVVDDPQASLLAVSLVGAFALAWLKGTGGLVAGVIAYALLVQGLRDPQWIDARGAGTAALEAARLAVPRGPHGPLDVTRLSLPLDLPGAPWTLAADEVRRSRPFDLPPGAYRIDLDAGVLDALPTARVLRVDVANAAVSLVRGYVREDQGPPVLELTLPEGGRRLVLVASGIQGIGRVTAARVRPIMSAPLEP